jgi:hypothetical protein
VRRTATVDARVTIFEDPRDLYPLAVPGRSRIAVRTVSGATVDVALWASSTSTVTEASVGTDRVARGKSLPGGVETLTYANPGSGPRVVFLAVTLAKGQREATYRFTVAPTR